VALWRAEQHRSPRRLTERLRKIAEGHHVGRGV
jgi:hypothetical protein